MRHKADSHKHQNRFRMAQHNSSKATVSGKGERERKGKPCNTLHFCIQRRQPALSLVHRTRVARPTVFRYTSGSFGEGGLVQHRQICTSIHHYVRSSTHQKRELHNVISKRHTRTKTSRALCERYLLTEERIRGSRPLNKRKMKISSHPPQQREKKDHQRADSLFCAPKDKHT